jgi:hypothetical protein
MGVRRELLVGTAAALVAAGVVTVAAAEHRSSSSTSAHPVWVDKGLNVVGGPVAGGGKVLVLVRSADKTTWLEAVDPANGKVSWKYKWAFSAITAGVITPPLAHGNVALLLAAGAKNDGRVRLEGIEISTGRVLWRGGHTVYVADAPSACPQSLGAQAFCVVIFPPTGGSGLIAIAPESGLELAVVPNVIRAMSTTAGVYQAAARTPTLVDIRVPGGVRWTKTVTSLYGANHNPDYGWDLDVYGTVDVGTISHKNTTKPIQLGGDTTIGVSESTGRRLWSIPGLFQCGGASGLRVPFTCHLTGTVVSPTPGKLIPSRDATVTIEGFDTTTGKITWQQQVGDIANLLVGNVAIADASHIAVTTPRGGKRLLDLTTGRMTAATGRVYWCARLTPFTINPPKRTSNFRVGSSHISPCEADKRPAPRPGAPADIFGASAGGVFVYAAPTGLTAIKR